MSNYTKSDESLISILRILKTKYKMDQKINGNKEEEEERETRAKEPVYNNLDEEILVKLKDDYKCLQDL
ncbi:hypothetical protein O3M35_010708 [Rhynocoris fuscipes]|uniref:Uncharacterized protein n=1 Tax=Rhynocoris fuscipes TaxID=488301 RepID=A0AAW1D0Y1_9HEMI